MNIQRLLGYARMADLMLTGRVLTAAEGERMNLCQYVVPAGQSFEKAKELARQIATNAPLTNWAVCAVLPRVGGLAHDDGLAVESLIGASVRSTEGSTRIQAFLEGRAAPIAPKSEG